MLEDYKEKQRKQHKVYYAHLSCTFSIDKSFLWFSVILCLLVQKWESESRSVGSDSLQSHGLYSPWNSPGQNTGADSLSLLQGIFPTQGSNPGLPCCRRTFLPAESQGKPKNAGVGSLFLLQQIFLTQESDQGLLHCRCILNQESLSYQGSPS